MYMYISICSLCVYIHVYMYIYIVYDFQHGLLQDIESIHSSPALSFIHFLYSGLYSVSHPVQSLSHAQIFAAPKTAEYQASLSIASSWNLLKRMSIELVMPSNHLILCRLLSFKPAFSLSSFTFIKRLFCFSSLSAIWVVSFVCLRLLIFLLAILIPACASLEKCKFSFPAHFKSDCFCCRVVWVPYTFWVLTPYQIDGLWTFSLIL